MTNTRHRIGDALRRLANRIDGGPPVVTFHLHAAYEPCTSSCRTVLAGPKP